MKHGVILILLLFYTLNTYAQTPKNDSFSSPEGIYLIGNSATFSGTTLNATPSNLGNMANICFTNNPNDVWFLFASDPNYPNYQITIDGENPNANPIFTVYSYSASLPIMGCSNNNSSNQIAELILNASSSTIYMIRVADAGGASLNFTGTITPVFPFPVDVGISTITKADTGCLVSITDTISVVIQNFTNDTITHCPVAYQQFGEPVVTEIFNGIIMPNDSVTYTFLQTTNLKKSYNNSIKAWTILGQDTDLSNDTMQYYIDCISFDSDSTPYVSKQIILQYIDNITPFDKDTIRQMIINGGGNLLDTTNCLDNHLDLFCLPDSFLFWGGLLIGAESQVEGLSLSTTRIRGGNLNKSTKKGSHYKDNQLSEHIPNRISPPIASHYTAPNTVQNYNTGNAVKLFILDTGADLDSILPYLSNIICPFCDNVEIGIGYDYINDDNDPTDDNGHGTKVISRMMDYINANSLTSAELQLIPLKVLDHDGLGSLWTILLGTITVKALHGDVINFSAGWTGGGSSILEEFIEETGDSCHGLWVTSAGNDTLDNDLFPHHPSDLTQYLDNVISVGALDNFNLLADYSNYGSNSVDIAAPGIIMTSIGSDRGTSFAAPYVAIRAAHTMIIEEHRTAFQIKDGIRRLGISSFQPLVNPFGNPLAMSILNDATESMLMDSIGIIPIDSTCHIQTCDSSVFVSLSPSTFISTQDIVISAYPNPFTNEITIDFDFLEATIFDFQIFDIMGRPIYMHPATRAEGSYKIQWDGSHLPTGVYFCYIKTKKGRGVLKIVK